MRRFLAIALVAMAPLCAQTVVIRNATIMTVTHGTVKGSIVIKDGMRDDIVYFINMALWEAPLAERYDEQARIILKYQDSPGMIGAVPDTQTRSPTRTARE